MKFLIITQAVDRTHSNLALAHRWIEEFAKHAEHIEVICLKLGRSDLPNNVHVHSLGKEKGPPRFARRLVYSFRFLSLLWRLRGQYDAVFVHMNPEYVVLGGWLWRMMRKKIALWYTHKSVNLKLRLAAFFSNIIFTASKESFRLKSRKVRVVGHGIDTELFSPRVIHTEGLRIVTVGRITKTKRIMEMLRALDVLYARGIQFDFTIIGAPILARDEVYEEDVRKEIARRQYADRVHFSGTVPYEELPNVLARESVFINLSETGSVDRAVLEAMSIGLVPVTSNEAFRDMFEPDGLYVEGAEPERLADALVRAKNVDRAKLSRLVKEHHSLQRLIPAILDALQTL